MSFFCLFSKKSILYFPSLQHQINALNTLLDNASCWVPLQAGAGVTQIITTAKSRAFDGSAS